MPVYCIHTDVSSFLSAELQSSSLTVSLSNPVSCEAGEEQTMKTHRP